MLNGKSIYHNNLPDFPSPVSELTFYPFFSSKRGNRRVIPPLSPAREGKCTAPKLQQQRRWEGVSVI